MNMEGNEPKYQEILRSSAQKICVIAGPGSGKTKCVLIPKAKDIISNPAIDPSEVLIVSFSRLTAQDLQERVKELERVPRACTLHSLCLQFLLFENNHDIRNRVDTIVFDFEKESIMISDLKIKLSQTKPKIKANAKRI